MAIPSLTRQVTRGDKSRVMLRWAFSAAAALVSVLIASSTIDQPYKALALVAAWLVLIWLFFWNFWFQNKVIGIIGRAEARVWTIGAPPTASGRPSFLAIAAYLALIVVLWMLL